MAKKFIEIGGNLYNLDMLTEVEPIGPQGTGGYKLSFADRTGVKLTVGRKPKDDNSPEAKSHYLGVAIATAIRNYLHDKTIRVTPGPHRDPYDD